jgi:hypothetical protein
MRCTIIMRDAETFLVKAEGMSYGHAVRRDHRGEAVEDH